MLIPLLRRPVQEWFSATPRTDNLRDNPMDCNYSTGVFADRL
jgi:hypothetical protein